MLGRDGGNSRNYGYNNVRGVEPPSHPYFQYGDICLHFGKIQKGQAAQHLEICRWGQQHLRGDKLFDHIPKDGKKPAKILFGDGLSCYLDALPHSHKMGGSKESGTEAVFHEDKTQHGTHRAFSVGPGHVDRRILVLGIVQGGQDRLNIIQPEFYAQVLYLVQINEALLIIH